MERNAPITAAGIGQSPRTIRGWTLPTTLFGLALLLSSVHLLTFESIDARLMIAEMLRGERLHQEATSAIATHAKQRGACGDVTISSDSDHPPYEVCGEERLSFVSKPSSRIDPNLLPDYDAVFSVASACPAPPVGTDLPFRGAPRAHKDCFLPSTIKDGASVLENIRGGNVSISPPTSGFTLLASPGSLSLSGDLTIGGDLLIMAGGDVDIGRIRGVSLHGVAVTIISSLGGITVGKTDGAVSLLVAGRGSLNAPETTGSTSFPMPPMRSPSIYSLRAVER
jgi:hypothetical protein